MVTTDRSGAARARAVLAAGVVVAAAASLAAAGRFTDGVTFEASDGSAFDLFGVSVGIDDDVVVVGSFISGQTATNSGSAHVFRRAGAGWAQEAKLSPEQPSAFDFFGDAVSVSGDSCVIGSPIHAAFPPIISGAAFVFTRRDGAWIQEARLTASDASDVDYFGGDVAIDGDRIVVGARHNDDDTGKSVGSGYVFERVGGVWVEAAKLVPDDVVDGAFVAHACDLAGDHLVLGAPGAFVGVAPGYRGGAYVYSRTSVGWTKVTRLSPPADDLVAEFGTDVAISGDSVLVAAWRSDASGSFLAPVAYSYVRSGSKWKLRQRLEAPTIVVPEGAALTPLRLSCALRGDVAALAGRLTDIEQRVTPGSVRVFVREHGDWVDRGDVQTIGAPDSDWSGFDVALGTDSLITSSPGAALQRGAVTELPGLALWTARVAVASLSLSLKFADGAADRVTLAGDVPPVGVPASLAGQTAAVTIGPVARTVTLDAKGKGASDDTTVIVRRGKTGRPASVTVQIRGDFSAELAPLGMDGSASEKKVRTPIVGSIDIGGGPVTLETAVLFTGTAGKSGSAALTRK